MSTFLSCAPFHEPSMCNLLNTPDWHIYQRALPFDMVHQHHLHSGQLDASCRPEAAPLGARLGDSVAKEHDIGLQHAAAHVTGRDHEVTRRGGQVDVAIWPSLWRLCSTTTHYEREAWPTLAFGRPSASLSGCASSQLVFARGPSGRGSQTLQVLAWTHPLGHIAVQLPRARGVLRQAHDIRRHQRVQLRQQLLERLPLCDISARCADHPAVGASGLRRAIFEQSSRLVGQDRRHGQTEAKMPPFASIVRGYLSTWGVRW